MRDWLYEHWDWLCAGLFLSLATSTAVGVKEGTKGGALFVSHTSAAVMFFVCYPFISKNGLSGEWAGLLAIGCGVCGTAMFNVLISLRNLIDRRRDKLAGLVANKVLPGAGDET